MDIDDEGRSIAFLVIVGFISMVLIGRLVYLQIIQNDLFKQKAQRNSLKSKVMKASRGLILDRDGKVLTRNNVGYQVVYILGKKREANPDDVLLISELTGMSVTDLKKRIKNQPRAGYENEVIAVEDLDKEIALRMAEKITDSERIEVREYNKRFYPEDMLASHIIGYMKPIDDKEWEVLKSDGSYNRNDYIGKRGVEKQYDKVLKGIDGEEIVEVDAHRNVKSIRDRNDSVAGKNIYLSIDLDLQRYMTEQFKNDKGAFIAMEAKTGKIIVAVSNPEYSLNFMSSRFSSEEWDKLINDPNKPLNNKFSGSAYPPGSTFKVVTGMAILEAGISPQQTMYSTGSFQIGRTIFRDSHRGGHGTTNFYKAIRESVNTYFYTFSREVGIEKVAKTATDFGLGERTGIDIPGEEKGVVPTPEWKMKRFNQKWLPGDLVNMSIGQGYVLTTPLQVLMVYQGIANKGVMYKPTVVDKFVSFDGKVENKEPEVLRKLPFKPENIEIMREALKEPVNKPGGTARILYFPNIPVSAKTGTAQNTGFKDHHSWLAGYFPSDNPEIVFISLVEGGGYGGVASGDLVRKFIIKYNEKYNIAQ